MVESLTGTLQPPKVWLPVTRIVINTILILNIKICTIVDGHVTRIALLPVIFPMVVFLILTKKDTIHAKMDAEMHLISDLRQNTMKLEKKLINLQSLSRNMESSLLKVNLVIANAEEEEEEEEVSSRSKDAADIVINSLSLCNK